MFSGFCKISSSLGPCRLITTLNFLHMLIYPILRKFCKNYRLVTLTSGLNNSPVGWKTSTSAQQLSDAGWPDLAIWPRLGNFWRHLDAFFLPSYMLLGTSWSKYLFSGGAFWVGWFRNQHFCKKFEHFFPPNAWSPWSDGLEVNTSTKRLLH